MWYYQGTSEVGTTFYPIYLDINGFVDAYFDSDCEHRKSMSGYGIERSRHHVLGVGKASKSCFVDFQGCVLRNGPTWPSIGLVEVFRQLVWLGSKLSQSFALW